MIASTHRLPTNFLDYYRVTGIDEIIKTSQSNRLNICLHWCRGLIPYSFESSTAIPFGKGLIVHSLMGLITEDPVSVYITHT